VGRAEHTFLAGVGRMIDSKDAELPRRASMSNDAQKLEAARAALAELPHEGVIGLGSGSTVRLFLIEVAALVNAGRALVGVATSEDTRSRAVALGIPVLPDIGPWDVL